MQSEPAKPVAATPGTSASTLLLGLIAAILVVTAMRAAQSVLVPLLLAWMISQIMSPLVKFFSKGRIPTGLAIILSLLLVFLVFYWAILFITANAISLINEKLPNIGDRIMEQAFATVRTLSERFPALADLQTDIRNEIRGLVGFTTSMAFNIAQSLGGLLMTVVMIFIMVAFMMVAQPYTENKIHTAFDPAAARRITRIVSTISTQLSHYLAMQFSLSLLTGVLVGLTCRVFGVPGAVTWGALAFVLNFIPTLGSILAGIPPVLLALLEHDTLWPALWTLLCVLAINQVVGNILSPKMMGDRLNLSPTMILLSLLFWGWVWGIPGLFLSVVITSSIKIACENFDTLRPLAVMMESGARMPAAAKNSEQ